MTPLLTRRACLTGALATLAIPARADAAPPRLVALDWGWAATAVALGLAPVGVAEQRLYRDWVTTPAIPSNVAEVGLRAEPSFETIAALKPDLILTNALNEAIRPKLERIAPVLPSPIFADNKSPLANSKTAARLLGEKAGRKAQAEALIAATEATLATARERFAGRTIRPLLPLGIIDARHVTIYGKGSLFADTMGAMGLPDLWPGPTSLWGHATRPVADLAALPPGDLLIVAPVPPNAADLFSRPGLVASLCTQAGRRVLHLPAAWGFGDLTAASRFADLLTALLQEQPA